SLVLPPDVFGPHPTTDGGPFHLEDVPLVNFLTAPFYLFDAMDTLDKIHRPSLVPVTRAAVRIVESTAGVSAAAMRAGRSCRVAARAASPRGRPRRGWRASRPPRARSRPRTRDRARRARPRPACGRRWPRRARRFR